MSLNTVFTGRHKKIHLVGIGGIGMSGIARVLLESGFLVSGSDLKESSETENLRASGAKVLIGHRAENVGDADVLVYSSAVKKDNVELLAAQKNLIPILPRAIMLAELMRLRCGIAIAGAHGKTTTTSLIGTLMHAVGLDPTVIIGGVVNQFGANAVVGKSQFMVTEADESDGTFLHLSPTIAVVTNIDEEHLDFYQGGIKEIRERFTDFMNGLPFYGLVVACIDDRHVAECIALVNRRVITYGFSKEALYRADNLHSHGFTTEFDLIKDGRFIRRYQINMVGDHNVLNALSAIAVLEELGVDLKDLSDPLKNFSGVRRRFSQIKGSKDCLVIDDYAHHPTEIRAVLKAARRSFADKKLRVLFQPHRFSRTKDLMTEFSSCFNDCDSLVVTEIFSADETPILGVNARALIKKITSNKKTFVHHASGIEDGAKLIAKLAQKNDVVLTLGAGSISTAGPKIIRHLNKMHERKL